MLFLKHGLSLFEILIALAIIHVIFFLSLATDQFAMNASQNIRRFVDVFLQGHAYQDGLLSVGAYSLSNSYWQFWDNKNQEKLSQVLIQTTPQTLIFFWNSEKPDCTRAVMNSHCVSFVIQ